MIDLGEASALASDRRRAALTAGFVLLIASAILPVANVQLGSSYSLFAVVIALAIAAIAMTSVLLWAQAHVTRSIPLCVLAMGYAVTAAVMMPYMLFYRGLWPLLSRLFAVDAHTTSSWLWAEWHVTFVAGTIAYALTRRYVPPAADDATFLRVRRRLTWLGLAIVTFTIPPILWSDGLPPFVIDGEWSAVSLVMFLVIIAGASASIGLVVVFHRARMLLDLWLVVTLFSIVADVVVSHASRPFAAGWYVSRVNILVTAGALLIVMLFQTAKIYGQLAHTAERLRAESLTDALTGLINRRGFDRRLAHALRDCGRSSRPIALLMIDIDNFKVYNDTFGHQKGDVCLRTVAGALRGAAGRAADLVARLGGEEMAVIMAETDARGAAVVAERMRRAIEELALRQGPGAAKTVVTVSVGVSSAADAARVTAERLVKEADRALYAAKSAGRNRAYQFAPLSADPVFAG